MHEEGIVAPAILLALIVTLVALLLTDRPVRQLLGLYPTAQLDSNGNPFTRMQP